MEKLSEFKLEQKIKLQHERESEQMLDYYYIAQLNDDGEIETSDKTKQFLVAKNSEIRFILRRGTRVAHKPVLLINKPLLNSETGEIQYTVTQPMIPTGIDVELGEYRVIDYQESPVESKYLERVDPYNEVQTVNVEFRVRFPYSGSFFIQIEYREEQDFEVVNYTQPVYINVEPVISLRDEVLKCKQLSILTVLSRCLGPISRWEQVLSNVSQLGYNAVHYTPLQQYGQSYSHYSLADQTLIDDYYFGSDSLKTLSREERLGELKQIIGLAREEYGLLGIVDIVLNHTANNSPWLLEHPEAAYNTDDCPQLYSAWLLDKELANFSDDYSNRKNTSDCPSAPFVNNEQDLKAVLAAIQNRVINKLNLHEYFMFNVDQEINELRTNLKRDDMQQIINDRKAIFERRKWFQQDHYMLFEDKFIKNLGFGPDRFQVQLNNLKETSAYFYICNQQNVEKTCIEVRTLMLKHNTEWTQKVSGFMKEALGCIEGTIRYFKLELKDNKITKENKLVRRYFTELPNFQQSKVAHNGWIMNADPMEDFALKGWHYLRRTINIWSDSVKLRYGSCPQDSPFLWDHMSTYVQDMATMFDGFRLDNAHSTPIHVCYYLLQVARSANSDLYVMAELFTSSALADAIFVQKLNINGLVREIQNTYDTKQLGDYFHQLTCREAPLGLLDQEFENIEGGKYRVLKPIKPSEIIYDCTHDNPAPVQKFKTGRIALSHLGIVTMADSAIASTWGYDQLIPSNLNVVTEKKLYAIPDQQDLFKPDNEDPHKRKLSTILEKHGGQKPSLAHQINTKVNSPEWTPEVSSAHSSGNAVSAPTEFDYQFVFYNDWAGSVSIAGEFNGWKPNIQMKKEGGNKWTHKITLPLSGQNKYEFKFVVNGKDWQINKDLPQIQDKSGNINNAVYSPGAQSQSPSPTLPSNFKPEQINYKSSFSEYQFQDIRYARRILNEMHDECNKKDAEIFLHQQTDQILVVVRQFDLDHEDQTCSFEGANNNSTVFDAYVSITRHPYFMEGGEYSYQTRVELPGYLAEVVMASYLEIPQNAYNALNIEQQQIKSANATFKLFKDITKFCKIDRQLDKDILVFHTLPPSFTCLLKTKYPQHMREAVKFLNTLSRIPTLSLSQQLFTTTPLSGFNHLLFRCNEEERDISNGTRGPYGLQQYGEFKYAGITSIMHILRQLKVSGDMGHELLNNVREGNWLIDYSVERLKFMMGDEELGRAIGFLNEFIGKVKLLNSTFRPKYLTRVVEKLYNAAQVELLSYRMSDDFIVGNQDLFLQRLALASIQMWGRVPSTYFSNQKDSMAAGLPHFTTGYMRCWGRDTFISLRGLLIAPGLEEEAKQTILYFAKTMRNGLIPNLHDRCNNTRFNARDATWFFIQGIKDFVELSKTGAGFSILQEPVELFFRDNDQRVHLEKLNRGEAPRRVSIGQLIHEILQAHASGIQFREWNAGTQIDSCMKNEGFNINIHLDEATGLVYGGNAQNCGTWMDKMGSSDKTGNRGVPATPRDGAPIELVALLYAALSFMQQMHEQGHIQTDRVTLKSGSEWTYQQWADKIRANFERHFLIPLSQTEDKDFIVDKKYVRRRGIYKDVYGSTQPHTDYQLRPNLCVAMAYAPDLFHPQNAQICLKNVEDILMEQNCMGIKTLDPQDPNYKGDYINSDDSQGWNYHQGPEWLWPVGFFLKSKIIFSQFQDIEDITHDVMKWIVPHQKHIMRDQWEGLPELTNSHGSECKDSCTSQAWSIATILDALRDLHYLRLKKIEGVEEDEEN